MATLDTQRSMRPLQRLPFCYLCGGELDPHHPEANRDHVPPSTIFAVADRNFPLILPTHTACNGGWSQNDDALGQLVGLLHGQTPPPQNMRFRVVSGELADGTPAVAWGGGPDLRWIIRRCVKGFHAALYREPLVDAAVFSSCPPLPEAQLINGQAQVKPVPVVIPEFVKELKRNRLVGTLDRIVCRNGRCRYECVWAKTDDGQDLCVFGFDLYGWKDLGDPNLGQRGCIGSYMLPQARVPEGATRRTVLEVPFVPNNQPLDPFGN